MKATRYTILLLLVCNYLLGFSQKELGKKESKERIDAIIDLTKNKEFENALMVFYDTSVYINEDRLSNKYWDKLNRLRNTMELKKIEFENNVRRVDDYIHDFNGSRYCNSLGLLRMKLSQENSYAKTRKLKKSYEINVAKLESKVLKNSKELKEWERAYENNERESLFYVLEKDIGFIRYLCNEKRKEFATLVNKLKADKAHYNQINHALILSPEGVLRGLNYSTMSYEACNELINKLSNVLRISDSCFNALSGNNLELKLNYKVVEKKINAELPNLKIFATENIPLTSDQKFTLFGTDTFHTYQINKYGASLNPELNLLALYKLDVVAYFKLPYYTKKDIEAYKLTPEYLVKLEELKKIKEESQNTYYFFKISVTDKRVYMNRNTGLITFTLGSNVGSSARSAVAPGTINGIGFPDIETNKTRLRKYGKEAYTEKFMIQLDTADLSKLSINTDLYFVFRLTDKENVKFRYYVKGSTWHTIKSSTHNSQALSVVVGDRNSRYIYYRKKY